MKNKTLILILTFLFLAVAAKAQSAEITKEGFASYYSDSLEGQSTASGEPYRKALFTAAHRTLPFNTEVKVTNLNNNHSVVVRINDRGPFVEGRIIDVSKAAAEALKLLDQGVARVRIEILEQ